MKKIALAAAVVSILFAGAASAADMAPRYTKAPPPPPAAVFNWTGFYVGGEAGGIWGQADASFVFPPPATVSNRASTGIGGGFVGFQYQWNKLVLGVEANGLGIFEQGLGRSSCNPLANCAAGSTMEHRWGDGIWTVGGRAGLAFGMWMPYLTGGYAATRLNTSIFAANNTLVESFTQDRSGWYGGVGVDYAFNPNWIVGLEYRHYDFGSARGVPILAATGQANPFDTLDTSLRADTLVARLSYKFGWQPPVVVAKY